MAEALTIKHVVEAMRLLDEDQPVDRRTVYPKRWAKVMRERGTWDDTRMVEQQDLPIFAFGKRIA